MYVSGIELFETGTCLYLSHSMGDLDEIGRIQEGECRKGED